MTIAQLNDAFRTTFVGGRVSMTAGVAALPYNGGVLEAVRLFDKFTEDNDPYGEHDFGALMFGSDKFFWKIDYYDQSLEYGSENPADPAVTTRVLTVMLADEY